MDDINLNPEPAKADATGRAPDLIISSPIESPTGRTVDSRPGSGGRSVSRTDAEGHFSAELEGPLAVGKANEPQAVKRLYKRMRGDGRLVELRHDAQDDRGEDGAFDLDGRRVAVQVVVLNLDPNAWRALDSQGTASVAGSPEQRAQAVRAAFEHKRGRAKGTIPVLDATHLGALVGPELITEYMTAFGDPDREFELLEAWIVGPTTQHCFPFRE